MTSAEDLQKLAVILGLNSVEDVYQERFRVDRRRLETMLAGKQKVHYANHKVINISKMYYKCLSTDNLEESQTAQAFFHRVSLFIKYLYSVIHKTVCFASQTVVIQIIVYFFLGHDRNKHISKLAHSS